MLQRLVHRGLIGFCLGVPLLGLGQGQPTVPDLEIEQLYEVEGPRTRGLPVSADLKFFCDGENLFLYLHVHDEDQILSDDASFSDHVEIWFALPDHAYPEDFEYELHPNYVVADPAPSGGRGEDEPRFFSIFSEYGDQVNLEAFVEGHDYPLNDNERVPAPSQLRSQEVHFGLVGFALYPDERSATLLNREELIPVEDALHARLGNVEAGIQYQVIQHPSGSYELNARISPEALGFVQLPELTEVSLLVDVVDVSSRGQRSQPVLSSSPYRKGHSPDGFNRIRFQTPLQTNYTTIPDRFFTQTGYFPVCFYSAQDWIGTGIDVDALTYRDHEASRSLAEVKFTREPFQYDRRNLNGAPIETLIIERDFVNEIPKRHQYTLLYNYLVETDQIMAFLANTSQVANTLFRFPDGNLGLILVNRLTSDPFGWGDCGTCVEENITLHRFTNGEEQELLSIYQTDGPIAYCQIGDRSYPDYFVESVGWATEGETLVLRLSHRYNDFRKRIRVSWNESGEEIEIFHMD